MYVLIWIAAFVTVQGPMEGTIPDTAKFKDITECVEFAKLMTPRLQDWVRGRIKADWDHTIEVRYRCEKSGEPA